MQTHREEEEEVAGLRRKSEEIVRDALEIRPVIVDGEARESESWGSSPLIVSPSEEETGFDVEFAEDFMQGLRLEPIAQEHDEEDEGDEEEEEEEEEEGFEFAFVCENPDGSPISAEEAFQDGRIKPFYPVFGRNIFLDEDTSQSISSSSSSFVVEERVGNPSSSSSDGGDPLEGLAEGTYCLWRTDKAGKAGEGLKGVCRKSNSTGFSKLWRVKDLVMRSSSDGKDAFVFLNPKKAKENTLTATTTIAAAQTKSAAKSKAKAVTVAVRKDGQHGHKYLVRSDKNRRRSYLPYKVGFFTNMNGMSRNVHPY